MKQRLHIKRSIVMNKKSCISVLRGRSDRFQTGYWSGFSECTNSALYHSSDTLKHKIRKLQTHQRADGWPQESVSGNQRGRSYEQPDFVQGQVGQNLSVLHICNAFRMILFDNLLCEVLAPCAFLFLCHFVHSFFLSFIVAHFPEIEKVCKPFFNLHTLFTSSSRAVILKYSGSYSVIVLSQSLKYIFIWLHKCN